MAELSASERAAIASDALDTAEALDGIGNVRDLSGMTLDEIVDYMQSLGVDLDLETIEAESRSALGTDDVTMPGPVIVTFVPMVAAAVTVRDAAVRAPVLDAPVAANVPAVPRLPGNVMVAPDGDASIRVSRLCACGMAGLSV